MLEGMEIINNAVFCGYPKSKIIKKVSGKNIAYYSEAYVLGRTILSEIREFVLFDIIYSTSSFITVSSNNLLDVNSKLVRANRVGLNEMLMYKEKGVKSYDERDIQLWQMKNKLLKGDNRGIIKFYTTSQAMYVLEHNKDYNINKYKDTAIICDFLSKIIYFYQLYGVDVRSKCNDILKNYNDTLNIYDYYKDIMTRPNSGLNKNDIETMELKGNSMVCFYRVKNNRYKYCYGKSDIADVDNVIRLFALRHSRYDELNNNLDF